MLLFYAEAERITDIIPRFLIITILYRILRPPYSNSEGPHTTWSFSGAPDVLLRHLLARLKERLLGPAVHISEDFNRRSCKESLALPSFAAVLL